MILKEALRSVWNDRFRSFFFWLTFFLTTFFIFVFFTLACEAENDSVMTFVTIFMVLVCTMDIFSVNHFYMVSKAKDLAVRLICGATYTYLSFYLLIQVVFLLLLALPAGILAGVCSLPLIGSAIGMHVAVSAESLMRISVMIGYIVFWILLFNLSFTYKSAASMMFNMQSQIVNGSSDVLSLRHASHRNKGRMVLFFLFLLCPLILLWDQNKPSAICAGFETILFLLFIKNSWLPYLDEKMGRSGICSADKLVWIGFHRMNIRRIRINIILLNGTTLLVYGLLDLCRNNPIGHTTVLLCFVMVSVLLWLAFLFQYETEEACRKKSLATLLSIGYTKENLRSVARSEVLHLYGSVLLFEMLCFIPISISHILRQALSIPEFVIVCAGYLVPMCICMMISFISYDKILSTLKKEK